MSSQPQAQTTEEPPANQQDTDADTTEVSDLTAVQDLDEAATRTHLDAVLTAHLPRRSGDRLAPEFDDRLTSPAVIPHCHIDEIVDVEVTGDTLKVTVTASLWFQPDSDRVPTSATEDTIIGEAKRCLHTDTDIADIEEIDVTVPPYAVPGDP